MCQVRQEDDGKFMMCTKYGKWMHGRCTKMKRLTLTLAKGFICKLCVDAMEGIVEPSEENIIF